jgi:starch synthase
MRYGTIPVVRRTGGLVDTVQDYDPMTGKGTGFVFEEESPYALVSAVRRAIDVYHNKYDWQKLIINAMKSDFSWRNSAREYIDLYQKAIQKRKMA